LVTSATESRVDCPFRPRVFEVTDHDVDLRRATTAFYFILLQKNLVYVSLGFSDFFVCKLEVPVVMPQGDPTSD